MFFLFFGSRVVIQHDWKRSSLLLPHCGLRLRSKFCAFLCEKSYGNAFSLYQCQRWACTCLAKRCLSISAVHWKLNITHGCCIAANRWRIVKTNCSPTLVVCRQQQRQPWQQIKTSAVWAINTSQIPPEEWWQTEIVSDFWRSPTKISQPITHHHQQHHWQTVIITIVHRQ